MIKCKYCGKVDHYEVISGKHTTTCKEYPVKCPRGCTQSAGEIKRKDLKKHAEVCPLEEVQCPFSEAGCDASILRRDLDFHIEMGGQQHLMKMMTAYNKLKEDFKRMSSRVASLTPIEPVKLTDENSSFSFIITSSEGWISPPFCVPGGYKLCIKHKEGKMANLMLLKEKYHHGELPMDSRYRLEISYSEVSTASDSMRQPTDSLLFMFDLSLLTIAVDDCDKEVAWITMPKANIVLSTNIIIVKLVRISMLKSLREMLRSRKM
jgi:hypothetical protein